MSRSERKRSQSGIYHIMFRGINKQTIFMDNEDYQRLLTTIARFKEISGYELYAYCIMSNHVHLLVKESGESISDALKRISSSYVFWYNKKYERCGHLFQERFKSEVVETDEYFLTVLRYIHQNPTKAGIVADIADYKWSSYMEYLGKQSIVDVDFALDMFSPARSNAIELCSRFNHQNNVDVCLEYDVSDSLSDEVVKARLAELGITSLGEIMELNRNRRRAVISQLKALEGVTNGQISRVTGLSKYAIHRV